MSGDGQARLEVPPDLDRRPGIRTVPARGVTADVAMCAEGQNVGGSRRANAAGLVRQRWLGSVRGDQFQAELANLARIDVGVLLFGLSDQRSDRLHFPTLDVGDDFRIRRE